MLTWPLLTLSIPPERIGVFGGLKTTTDSAVAFLAGFVVAVLVGLWSYRSIFVVRLVASVASLAVRATVRIETSSALAPAATLGHDVIIAP